ncbi:hypothetical protein CBW65_11270 [Tumebacillus avium]|uniref:Uncharacterized protein n=1 Tax=Tumebacillus avium TaxID=1903704 RepID=A0A1Y0IQA3_9BACL|nr:hypothetical protein [Tumebacillus avium]ARU61524.1 hypothetical protein CBW65_11270 [Tumebacillus avium]
MFDSFQNACRDVMKSRGWQYLLGKDKEYKQSLLDHSMALVNLGQVLLLHGIITASEEQTQALLLALAVHDAGKEHAAFQTYMTDGGKSPGHIDVDLSREVALQISEKMEWNLPSTVLDAAVSLHMKASDRNGDNLFEVLMGHSDTEWRKIAQWVQDIDRIASAKTPQAAKEVWNRSQSLSKLRKAAHHSIRLRGVSSVYVHNALRNAFQEAGWSVLMYYPFGNLYVAREPDAQLPDLPAIKGQLKHQLEQVMAQGTKDKVKLMHGSIIATYFVKPDLFTLDDLSPLLAEAEMRINEQPASNVSTETILSYWNVRSILSETGDSKLAKKAAQKDPRKLANAIPEAYHPKLIFDASDITDSDRIRLAQRLGEARKEMAIFKMFKNVMSAILEDKLSALEHSYDEVFGSGAYASLQTTATLMPALDMAFAVDYFWELNAEKYGFQGKMGHLEKKQRRHKLINILTDLAGKVFAELKIERTVESLVRSMSEQFIEDIDYPVFSSKDIVQLAKEQLQAAIVAKTNVNSSKAVPHLCPLCNNEFKEGVLAISDFVNKATAFSNRISAYNASKFQICRSCYYERLLQQLLLGGRPGEFLCVIPTGQVPFTFDERLEEKIQSFERSVWNFTEGKGAVTHALSLTFESMLARNLDNHGELFGSESFADLFVYTKSKDRLKEERKNLLSILTDLCGDDLELGNAFANASYSSFDELLDALLDGKHVDEPSFEEVRLAVRTSSPIKAIYQTPNFILFPTIPPMSRDSALKNDGDGEAKYAYKQLFLATLFAEYLGMSVAVLNDLESVHLLVEGMSGSVYVPDHPRVRKEIIEARKQSPGSSASWLLEHEALTWRRAIQGAILLKEAVGFPERDDIPRILAFTYPGQLLRRIEAKQGNKHVVSLFEWEQIQKIQEVLA